MNKVVLFALVALQISALSALPPCICTFEYRPVCGSDGVTYSNRCGLNCARSSDTVVDIAHEGACAEKVQVAEPAIPACKCTRETKPVCGSNGVTYSNACLLNCATADDNLLSVKHTGNCEKAQVAEPDLNCICTRDMKPVCGSNGVTYNNACLLNCATAKDNLLSIQRAGRCEDVLVAEPF